MTVTSFALDRIDVLESAAAHVKLSSQLVRLHGLRKATLT